jgi:thiamine pyrophosphokinase
VRTEGLEFPLRGETLYPGSTRGVSNEFVDGAAAVSLDDGVLLVVLPHTAPDEEELS